MNKQEIFNKVAAHLIKQGHQSKDDDDGNCLYRGPNGSSCAVGCLLSPDEYHEVMEEKSVDALVKVGRFPQLPAYFADEISLLLDLQQVHDKDNNWGLPVYLLKDLNRVAAKFNLTPYAPTPEGTKP